MNNSISTHFSELASGTVTINAQSIFGTHFSQQQTPQLIANSTDGIAFHYWNNQKRCDRQYAIN